MTIKIEISKSLTEDQTKKVDQLWNEVYPIQLNNRFRLLLEGIEDYNHHLLLNEADEVIGWAVAFFRANELWFSILISATNQNKGNGKMLLDSLKRNSTNLCGWVIDHNNDLKQDSSTYYTPMQFYLKNGFIVMEQRIETAIISAVKIKFEV